MRRLVSGSVLAALSLVCAAPALLHAQTRVHTFYARVTDAAGKPLTALTPTDFGIIEAGKARKVMRAAYGGVPPRVVILTDTSDAISRVINPWRAGISALIDGIPTDDEIALVSMGGHMRIRVQPGEGKNADASATHKKAADEAKRVFSDGGGTVLLDSLREAYDRLLAKNDDRPAIIVLVTTDGPEISTSTREEEFNKLLGSLLARHTVVHAVVLGNGGTGVTGLIGGDSASAGLQHVVASNLTLNTGGTLETVAVATSLADKMSAIAATIRSQQDKLKDWYQVDYASDTPGSGQNLDVTISNMDAKFELSDRIPH
jgi:hypothetical protein